MRRSFICRGCSIIDISDVVKGLLSGLPPARRTLRSTGRVVFTTLRNAKPPGFAM